MSFMERARALYERDDVVRAAFVLAEGVKRDPSREDALNWLLQLYVEEMDGPGLEQELVRVIETQPDGDALLRAVKDELGRRQQTDRLSYLDRVQQLRQRAAQARAELQKPPSDEELLGLTPRRGRFGRLQDDSTTLETAALSSSSSLWPDDDDEPKRDRPRPARGKRSRGRPSSRGVSSAQGVLPLEAAQRGGRDSWRGFQGVAAHLDPEGLPPSTPPTSFSEPAQPPDTIPATPAVEAVAAGRVAEPVIPKPPIEKSVSVPASLQTVPSPNPSSPSNERTVAESVEPARTTDSGEMPSLGGRKTLPFDQLLEVEADAAWSFGESLEATPISQEQPLPVRNQKRGRRSRTRTNLSGSTSFGGIRRVGRGFKWALTGRRGPLLIVFVALLGGTGAGYRACTQFVSSQLAEADGALALADGESLHRAVELYAEHVPSGPSELSEKLDFARALLAYDFGDDNRELDYETEDVHSVYGAGAIALSRLAEGNLALARPLGAEITEGYPESWLAHWVRGRIAAAEGDWQRAESAFNTARQKDDSTVLPLVGLLDIALRADDDVAAELILTSLAELNPDHPMIPIARAAIAFGLDPLTTHAGNLEVVLPSQQGSTLSLRATELLTYLQAQRALAAWQLDQVGNAIRNLRQTHPGTLGVRVNLLDAVLAARRYRLEEATAALERSLAAAPEASPAVHVIRRLAADVFVDLGRPDLALQSISDMPGQDLRRARLLVDLGRETEALSLLSALMERPETQAETLRILVDYHLRRGVPDRARLRANGLTEVGDQAFAAARLATEELDWDNVRDQADTALRHDQHDYDALLLWATATSHRGLAERAIEQIDARATRSLLVGEYDRARLEVLVISERAPREVLAEFVGFLESTEPTSMIRLATLAHAYEAIGDFERARGAAERVIEKEPNNRRIHALLGRLYHHAGLQEESSRHLRSYLALAPETELTDWAREYLTD